MRGFRRGNLAASRTLADMLAPLAFSLVIAKAASTLVLTYHDIIPTRGPGSVWFDCTAAEFRAQIRQLTRWGAVFVSVEDLQAGLSGRKALPPKAVVLTFADGYHGVYDHAWPVMKRERIPFALYVHTGYVGSKVGRPKMTWDELGTMVRSGLATVGSQTVSHPADLRKLTDAQIVKEFTVSKRSIEKRFGVCHSLAYPNGKWDARSARQAEKAGYAMAFTEELKPAETAASFFEVPRYVHTQWERGWRNCRSGRFTARLRSKTSR